MTEAQLLDGQAFNRLVLENDLAGKTWEQDGYIYAGFKGVAGWELYRTYGPKWRMLYQGRRVNTSPAGGGVLVQRITIPTGMTAMLNGWVSIGPASAGATHIVSIVDEDGNIRSRIASLVAGASTIVYLPTTGTAEQATGKTPCNVTMLLGPGEALTCTASASLQTETQTVGVSILLPIGATTADITWDNTGSAAGATLAASTISAANTLQAVLLP